MNSLTKENINTIIEQKQSTIIYFYTPLCGTCQVAGRMLEIVEQMINGIPFGKADLNYSPEMARKFKVESVPCLLIVQEGIVQEKIYAFKSVPYLHATISKYL